MAGDFSVKFSLETLAGGQLTKDFKQHYMDVLNSLSKGSKGSVTIKVELARPKDMDTLVHVDYEVSSKKPKVKVGAMASIKEKNQQLILMTDKPKEDFQLNIVEINKNKEVQ